MRCGWVRVGIGTFLCIRLVRVGCCWRLSAMLVRVGRDAGVADRYMWERGECCAGGFGVGAGGRGDGSVAGEDFFGEVDSGRAEVDGVEWVGAAGVGCGWGGAWAGVVYWH